MSNFDNITEGTVYKLGEIDETSKYRGDFIGFQFGDNTSASLCVVRISDGSRYNEDLLPSFSDKTVQVAGSNQTYYFGSEFTEKQFTMEIAFDEITEEQFHNLSKVFSNTKPQRLTFDERPYKYYIAKVNSAPQFKYICFDTEDSEGNTIRVYKGEGTINFTCFYPFAKSWARYLDELETVNPNGYYDNITQWSLSSGMKPNSQGYDVCSNNIIKVFNAGDLETDWYLYIPFNNNKIITCNLQLGSLTDYQLKWKEINKKGTDLGVRINSRSNLIEGVSNGELTGNIYNEYITSGYFFKIPNGEYDLTNCPQNSVIDYQHIYY